MVSRLKFVKNLTFSYCIGKIEDFDYTMKKVKGTMNKP